MTDNENRLKGLTLPEIAQTLYGERGAMSALARGLEVTPAYLHNVHAGRKPVTLALSVKLLLLCRQEKEVYRKRMDEIDRLETRLGTIKMEDDDV